MKDDKLYNIIFPVWLFLFFPPVILITLAGNFIIDSLVVIAGYFLFKPGEGLSCLDFWQILLVPFCFLPVSPCKM